MLVICMCPIGPLVIYSWRIYLTLTMCHTVLDPGTQKQTHILLSREKQTDMKVLYLLLNTLQSCKVPIKYRRNKGLC